MRAEYYIYNNSSAQGLKGWMGKYENGKHIEPKIKGSKYKVHTTQEFAFAWVFSSALSAHAYLHKHYLAGLVFKKEEL